MRWLFSLIVLAALPAAADAQRYGLYDSVVVIKESPVVVAGKTIGSLEPGDDMAVQEDAGGEIKITFYPPDPLAEPQLVSLSKENVVPLDKAVDHFSRAIEAEPNKPSWRLARAKTWVRLGKSDEAASDFTVAARLNPRDARPLLERGLLWLDRQKEDQALADFDEAMRRDPQNMFAHVARAMIWMSRKDYDRTIADCAEAIRLAPAAANTEFRHVGASAYEGQAYFIRGECRAIRGDHAGAIDDHIHAVRLGAATVYALVNSEREPHKKWEYDKIVAFYSEEIERLERQWKETAAVNRGRGRRGARGGRPDAVDGLVAFDVGRLASRYVGRGNAWYAKGEYEKALADFRKAQDLRSEWEAHMALAHFWAACPEARWRDGRKAVDVATKACEQMKWNYSPPLIALARAYAEAGDFAAAVRWETKALGDLSDKKDQDESRQRLDAYRAQKPIHYKPLD